MTTNRYSHQTTTRHPSSPAVQYSSLARRNPSQILTRPLTPLLTLAAYGSLIVTAFSALIGLLVASYGLSAWDDAKSKLHGVRGIIGKGFGVGKDIVGAVTSTAFHHSHESGGSRTTAPGRATPERTYAPTNTPQDSGGPKEYSTQATGYEVPSEDEQAEDLTEEREWYDRRRPADARPSAGPSPPPQSGLPPRPPISVLIASLFLTLIVLTARLLVVWWMGQQAQKNETQAFRNAQRAYEAAHENHHHRHHHHHRHQNPSPSSSSSSSPPTNTWNSLSKPPSSSSSFSFPP